jgi:hypothetical protein
MQMPSEALLSFSMIAFNVKGPCLLTIGSKYLFLLIAGTQAQLKIN